MPASIANSPSTFGIVTPWTDTPSRQCALVEMKRLLDAVISNGTLSTSLHEATVVPTATKRCSRRRTRKSTSSFATTHQTAKSSNKVVGIIPRQHGAGATTKRRRQRLRSEIDVVLHEEGLLRLVFTFLDVRDHQIVRLCSRSWKRMVHSLAVDSLDLSIKSPVRSAPMLDQAFLAVMHSYRSVRRLDLSGQRTLADRDLLVLASHFWANLESIQVDDCLQLTDFALFSILNAQSLKLASLSFRHCKQLTGRFANATIAGKHPSLRVLDMFDTRVDLNFITLVEAAFPSLTDLNALHTPAHREWYQRQKQQGYLFGIEFVEELRLLVSSEFVELPHLSALVSDFEKRILSSDVQDSSGSGVPVFHRSLMRAARRSLIDLPMDASTGAEAELSSTSTSAIFIACSVGNTRSLSALLDVGCAALDVTDREGNTPLCIAASNGQMEALQLLLRYGAKADVRTRSLATPLYLASERNRDMVVDLLLQHGANPSSTVTGGATPLCIAARNGHFSTVERLLTAILEHDGRNRSQTRSLDDKIQFIQALFLACESGHTRVVAELLSRCSLQADELMDSSVTPLYLACQMGHEAIVTLLLRRGADANFQRPTTGGVSCLYIAAQEGHSHVVEHLVRWKVRIDARMEDQSTALHIAARMGHVDVVRVLIRAGAALDAQTRSGLSPLYIASEEGHVGLVRFLLASGAERDLQTRTGATALFAATQRGHEPVVRALLMAGASAHLPKHNGTYPTDAAALLGDYDIARLLLQFGARVGALSLHFAERRRDLRLQSLLLSRYFTQHLLGSGAMVPAVDGNGLASLRW